jgi:general secretion pathway protein J
MGRDERGFTLLEMLVATTLLAVMASFLAVAFRMASASVERGEEGARESARLRAAVGVVERALRSAHPMPLPGADPPLPWFRGEPDRLRFLTACPPSGVAEGLRLLSLRRSPGGELSLADESPFRGGEGEWAGTGEGRTLLPAVESLSFTYSGEGAGATEREWVDRWDSSDEKRLPALVRVEVKARPAGGGEARTTAFVVPLAAGG